MNQEDPMADIDLERERQTNRGAVRVDGDRHDRNDQNDRPAIKVVTARETRRSFVTTEFWLTLLAVAAVVIAGYWDEAKLDVDLAWSLAAGIVVAYLLSRGIAKAGSRDPEIRDLR